MENDINATIDAQGHVPERRFINPKDPKSGDWLYTHVRRFGMVGDMTDWERQRIESHLRLAAPFSTDDLAALGMENMPNYSRGDLSARVGDEERKWTDLIASHSGLWEVDHPRIPPELVDRFNSELADVLNSSWNCDANHVFSGQLVFRSFPCFGIGPMLWPDPFDPSPVARIASDFRFPKGTRIDLSNFTECSLNDKINAQELYRAVQYSKSEMGSDSGWAESTTMNVLKQSASTKTKGCFDSMTKLELDKRAGINPWEDYTSMEIPVIHIWVDEFEGDEDNENEDDGYGGDVEDKTISYMMIAKGDRGWVIIREQVRRFECPQEFLILAADRVGSDGTIAGLRGIGMDLRAQCESNDIMEMAVAYGAWQSSVPIYSCTNQGAADTAEQVTMRANGTVLPQGFTQVEAKLDVQHGMAFLAKSNNEMDQKQGQYSINAPNKGGVQRTAEEARQDSAKEGDVRSNQIAPLTRTFFVPLGRNYLRRILNFPRDEKTGAPLKFKGWKTVKDFDKRMLNTGIPAMLQGMFGNNRDAALAFMKETEVEFNSANTPGGLDKKLLKSDAMLKWMPFATSQAQRDAIYNSAMIALHGWKAAQPYLNKTEADVSALPSQERISMENAIMSAGSTIPVFEFQDHLRHLGPLGDPNALGHMAELQTLVLKVQQNHLNQFEDDPLDGLGEAITALLALMEHADMHLAFMSHNPALIQSDQVQPYFNALAQAKQMISQLAAGFMKEMEARASQEGGQQMDPKVVSLMQLTQAKIQAMQQTTAATIQQGELKHNVKVAQQQETAGIRSQLKSAQTLSDMAVNAEKGKADAIAEQTKNIQAQARVVAVNQAEAQKNVAEK